MTNTQPASAGTKTLVDSVIARFNGQDITFKIHRGDLPVFEARFGPAYHLYRRIAAGHWTVADIRNVLRFASAARPKPGTAAQYATADPALLAALENTREYARNGKPCAVQDAFAARGPAAYASLAALVLGAALVGIEVSEAKFSDEDVAEE